MHGSLSLNKLPIRLSFMVKYPIKLNGIEFGRNTMADNVCKWEPQFVDSHLRCHRRVDSEQPAFCILHLDDPNKPPEEFHRALGEKVVQDESNPQAREINLAGVVFIPCMSIGFALELFYLRKRVAPVGGLVGMRPVSKRITFAEATFLAESRDSTYRTDWVDFSLLSFHGPVSFVHARFNENVNFLDARFNAGANFNDAQFGKSALFGFTDQYSNLASWPEWDPMPINRHVKPSIFGSKTSFQRARFEGSATFYDCQFNEVDFSEVRFSEGVDFKGAQFYGRAIFKDASFDKGVRFGDGSVVVLGPDARFGGDADFSGVRFHGDAMFSGDVAHEGIKRVVSTIWQLLFNFRWRWSYFKPGPFEGNANFTHAQFDRGASFDGAHFAKRADFSNAKFKFRGADFRWVKFSNDALFIGTEFGAAVNFPGASFGGAAVFQGAKFPKEMYQPDYMPEVLLPFSNAKFNVEPDFGDYHLYRGYLRKENPRKPNKHHMFNLRLIQKPKETRYPP